MKHSTSSVLVKIRFLPFQVNLKVAGKASMYLTFSCWSAFLEGRNIFLFSANSLDVLGNTDSLTSSHSITCLSRAARSTFSHAVIRSRSRLTWHGGQYSKSPLNFELPSISIPRPSFRTLFTHLSGFPSVPNFFFSSTSLTLFLLLWFSSIWTRSHNVFDCRQPSVTSSKCEIRPTASSILTCIHRIF